jgi:thiosulfate/3-mercaptopyruvate sulfurtransferase
MSEGPLVTTAWLHDHLGDVDLRIVDIRGHVLPPNVPPPHYFNHYEDYLVSHIPGAVFVDWVYEITDPADPHHARIAPPARFAEVMARCGIGDDTFVVAYDDAGSMFAARLWWALNYYGHSRAAVLDGGWHKWVAEGRPVTSELPTIAPAVFTPKPQLAWLRTADQVMAGLATSMWLIDMRTPEEFNGKWSRAARYGHIPGAVNLPRASLVNPDGTLISPAQLRARLAALEVDTQTSELVTYCNAGVSAALGLLALRVAGFSNSALYDGSWKEWGNDPRRPIA